ncbi:hypothetical protein [Mannheimia indoligenes]|uniref:hypothetical protein n=1 Tax=Mannheimia indoligenes TaxID=3103145 RepID=UPI002FE52BD4
MAIPFIIGAAAAAVIGKKGYNAYKDRKEKKERDKDKPNSYYDLSDNELQEALDILDDCIFKHLTFVRLGRVEINYKENGDKYLSTMLDYENHPICLGIDTKLVMDYLWDNHFKDKWKWMIMDSEVIMSRLIHNKCKFFSNELAEFNHLFPKGIYKSDKEFRFIDYTFKNRRFDGGILDRVVYSEIKNAFYNYVIHPQVGDVGGFNIGAGESNFEANSDFYGTSLLYCATDSRFFPKKISVIVAREDNILLLSKVIEKYRGMLDELSSENEKILLKIKNPKKRIVLNTIYSRECRQLSKRKNPNFKFIDYHLNFYGHNYTEIRKKGYSDKLIKEFENVDEIKVLREQKKIREEESERERLEMEKLKRLEEEKKCREEKERQEKIKTRDSLPKLSGSLTIGLSYEYLENSSKDIEYSEFDYISHAEKDDGVVYQFETEESAKVKVMISLFINNNSFELNINIQNHQYEVIKHRLQFNLPNSEITKLY